MADREEAPSYLDAPPDAGTVTEYDLRHGKIYLRLLDAAADGADWREVVSVVMGLDPNADPERARRIHYSHLERARWMTRVGYQHLLQRADSH